MTRRSIGRCCFHEADLAAVRYGCDECEAASFVLDDPIPEYTTFLKGRHYDADTNSIHYEGVLGPGRTKFVYYWVKVDPDTPVGTIITNEAYLADDALGASASVTTEVIESP